jgi:hypothetical protein
MHSKKAKITINGREYTLEFTAENLTVIDGDSKADFFALVGLQIVFQTGEGVCDGWESAEWERVSSVIFAGRNIRQEIETAVADAVEAGSLTPDSQLSESEDPEVPALLVNLGEWRQESQRDGTAQKIADQFGLVEWASGHGEFGPITVYQLAK